MAVITLHPIVVHLECIAIRLFPVNENLPILHFKVVMFVYSDRTFIHGYIVHSQFDGLSFGRNPYRTVIVTCPTRPGIERIQTVGYGIYIIVSDTVYNVRTGLQTLVSVLCQRHGSCFGQ